MPRGDGTGPLGQGPLTGRRAGYCAGYAVPGYMNPPFWGRHWLGGWGGRGYRHRYYATGLPFWAWARAPYAPPAAYAATGPYAPPAMTPEEETEILKQEAERLRSVLSNIERRLEELKTT